VRVECRVLSFVADTTWAEFEQQTSRRAATGTTIEPENKGVFTWVIPRLEKPDITMRGIQEQGR
jgi:hypothetical protein